MKFQLVGESGITQRGTRILSKVQPYYVTISLPELFQEHKWAGEATFYVEEYHKGETIGLVRQSPHKVILYMENRIATDEEAKRLDSVICTPSNVNLLSYISQFLIVWAKHSKQDDELIVLDIWDKSKMLWATPKLKRIWCRSMQIPLVRTLAIFKQPKSKEEVEKFLSAFPTPVTVKASYKHKMFIVTS